MFNKIKQIKDLRDQAKQMKDTLGEEVVHGSAAGDKVTVAMDGNMEILSVDIEPELLNAENKEAIETAVKQAANDALKKAQRLMAQKFQASGLNLPGM